MCRDCRAIAFSVKENVASYICSFEKTCPLLLARYSQIKYSLLVKAIGLLSTLIAFADKSILILSNLVFYVFHVSLYASEH